MDELLSVKEHEQDMKRVRDEARYSLTQGFRYGLITGAIYVSLCWVGVYFLFVR